MMRHKKVGALFSEIGCTYFWNCSIPSYNRQDSRTAVTAKSPRRNRMYAAALPHPFRRKKNDGR